MALAESFSTNQMLVRGCVSLNRLYTCALKCGIPIDGYPKGWHGGSSVYRNNKTGYNCQMMAQPGQTMSTKYQVQSKWSAWRRWTPKHLLVLAYRKGGFSLNISLSKYSHPGPLCDIATSTLYWIDISRGAFHRLHRPTGKHERIEVDGKIGVLALRKVMKNGFAFWHDGKEGKDRLEYVASPYGLDHPYFRMNDGAVDCKATVYLLLLDLGAKNLFLFLSLPKGIRYIQSSSAYLSRPLLGMQHGRQW